MLLRFPCLFTKLFPACEKQSALIQMCKPCLENITPFHKCHLFDVWDTQYAGCPPTPQLIPPSPLQLRGTDSGTLGLLNASEEQERKV